MKKSVNAILFVVLAVVAAPAVVVVPTATAQGTKPMVANAPPATSLRSRRLGALPDCL